MVLTGGAWRCSGSKEWLGKDSGCTIDEGDTGAGERHRVHTGSSERTGRDAGHPSPLSKGSYDQCSGRAIRQLRLE